MTSEEEKLLQQIKHAKERATHDRVVLWSSDDKILQLLGTALDLVYAAMYQVERAAEQYLTEKQASDLSDQEIGQSVQAFRQRRPGIRTSDAEKDSIARAVAEELASKKSTTVADAARAVAEQRDLPWKTVAAIYYQRRRLITNGSDASSPS